MEILEKRGYILFKKEWELSNLGLNETLPDNFVVDPDADIGWTFDFEKNEIVSYRYGIRSTKAGKFTLTATELILTHLGVTNYKYTNSSQLIVHGPTINITKSIIPPDVILNNEVNITIDVRNDRDRAAHVDITDEIPAGAVLVSGKISDDIVLQPSCNHTIQYSIRMDKIGDIVTPSAKAKFSDAKGYSGAVESKKRIISVIEEPAPVVVEPEPVQEDVETAQPEEPVVETERSFVDKAKSLPSKAMDLPGFSALGLVFAILSAGAISSSGANTVDKDKRKK